MKREELLEAIGTLDENLLLEAEQQFHRKPVNLGRIGLVAAIVAILAITAAASAGVFSRPIGDVQIISGETAAPFDMDSNGNIIPVGVGGLKITMDVEVDGDAPEHLEEFYLMDTPEGWQTGGVGTPYSRYWLSCWDQIWWQEGKTDRMELTQTTAHNYKASDHQVDSLLRLSAEDGVTAGKAEIAGLEMLKVTIPALTQKEMAGSYPYCVDGETRLYWSDGKYILRFVYPAWVSDKVAETMLSSLYTKPVVIDPPEGYGTVDMDLLLGLVPGLQISDSGNTSANIQMTQGRYALRNGRLFCSLPGKILSFDLESGQKEEYHLKDAYTFPSYLFITDHYIGYVTDYDMVELLPLNRSHEETVLYEGISSINLYADGMQLYAQGAGLRRIDLDSGQVTTLADSVHSYYVDEKYVYVIPGDGETCVLRAEKGSDDFQRIDLSFQPIRVIADGEDLYLCKGGDLKRNMIRYRQGKEELLPINAYFYQLLDGKLIYRDENAKNTIKSYDLNTGDIQVLQENVFEFSILENRYICFDIFNSDSVLLDVTTGETVRIDTTD